MGGQGDLGLGGWWVGRRKLQGHLVFHGGGGLMFPIVRLLVRFCFVSLVSSLFIVLKHPVCKTILVSRCSSGQEVTLYCTWLQIPYKTPPSSVNSSTPRQHVGLQLEQPARGIHKRSPSAYREEGYAVTMETDGPTPVADGGGEGIGGWGLRWRDPEMIICPMFLS